MKPAKKLTDPDFVWIPSQTHDADSTQFRERQRARMAQAELERQRAAAGIVSIKRRKA